VLCCVVLCCVVLCCGVLCCVVLWCVVLCSALRAQTTVNFTRESVVSKRDAGDLKYSKAEWERKTMQQKMSEESRGYAATV
jgi:hypothetical protein